jgi:hypothetical protein
VTIRGAYNRRLGNSTPTRRRDCASRPPRRAGIETTDDDDNDLREVRAVRREGAVDERREHRALLARRELAQHADARARAAAEDVVRVAEPAPERRDEVALVAGRQRGRRLEQRRRRELAVRRESERPG